MSNKPFVPENIEKFRIGQIFSTYNLGINFIHIKGNGTTACSTAEYIVYLGNEKNGYDTWKFQRGILLVVFKNGDTMIWSITNETIKRYLDQGKFVKLERQFPLPLLHEIENYYPK